MTLRRLLLKESRDRILAIFLVLYLGFGLWGGLKRYRSGMNFGLVELRVPSGAREITAAEILSPFSRMQMEKIDRNGNLFKVPWNGGVKEIEVTMLGESPTVETFQIWVEGAWWHPARRLPVKQVISDYTSEPSRAGKHRLIIERWNRSVLKVPADCINWKGDLMLLIPPFAASAPLFLLLWILFEGATLAIRKTRKTYETRSL